MPTNSDKDFQIVRDKVNQIDQRMEETVLPALKDIKGTLEKMSFVSKKDYAEDMAKYELWKASVEKFISDANPAVKFFGILNSRWTQVLIGGIIVAALVAVGSQVPNIGIGK